MKIFILHRHAYWTEYLDFLLENNSTFEIVASTFAQDKTYKGQTLPPFDPRKHQHLLTPGIIDDPTFHNTIHFRSMHSPGFYILVHLIAYQGFVQYHPDSNFTMSILEGHYAALLTREIHHPQIDEIRYKLIQDPRVKVSKVNLDLYQFLSTPAEHKRKAGTGLICMSWLFMYVPISRVTEILSELSKELRLTLVIHPCTSSKPFIDFLFSLEGSLLETVYYALPRKELMPLFDQHEYIITDGSGSCYEAMLRGCKPLAIRDLYISHPNDMAMQLYYDVLEEDYFPFPSFEELSQHREFNSAHFLKKIFPFLYTLDYSQAKALATQEIYEAFSLK